MKRSLLCLLFLLLVCGGQIRAVDVSAPAAASKSAKPWNFVVILLDDAGWRDLGFTGNRYIETPNLDRLAERGMTFANAYATHPFCSPTRQSMITGQWPARTAWVQKSEIGDLKAARMAPEFSPAGTFQWTERRPEFVSLAEALRSKGYRTGHIGKWHFGIPNFDVSPESEGFEVNFGGASTVGAVSNFFAPFEGLPGKVSSQPGEYLTDRLTDETIRFIREHKDEPFYVQLWHYAPHEPLQAPEELVAKYRAKSRRLSQADLNPTYAAMVERIDSGVGRILDELTHLGLESNTVILLTSDNGGVARLGSIPVTSLAPLRGEKGWMYEGGIREPMAIVWPGHTKPGSTATAPASVLDFYPTVLDIAGVPKPEKQPVDGVSLVPLLSQGIQPDLNERPLYWYNVTANLLENGTMMQPVAAVRQGSWKLLKFFADRVELYNLAADPSEKENRAAREPKVAAELEKLLDEWLEDTGVELPQKNPAYDPKWIIPRQIAADQVPSNATMVRQWQPGAPQSPWREARMARTETIMGALRVHATGGYPEIVTREVGLPAGKYAVQIKLRVPTSGRVRFSWKGKSAAGEVIEFFPSRDGKWQTLNGVFEARSPIEEFRLAGPTHLKESGFYDPAVDTDYLEVAEIVIFKW